MAENRANDGGYVSIQTEVLVEALVLDKAGLDAALAGFAQKAGSIGLSSEIEYHSDEFAPSLRKIRQQHPDIASWIDFQQQALSALALQLNSQRVMLASVAPQMVAISASTIEFSCAEGCEVGDHLEITLSLGAGMPTIYTIGVVDKMSESSADNDTAENRLTVQFSHIREPDQEILIRHIHKTQLTQIRSARASRQESAQAS